MGLFPLFQDSAHIVARRRQRPSPVWYLGAHLQIFCRYIIMTLAGLAFHPLQVYFQCSDGGDRQHMATSRDSKEYN